MTAHIARGNATRARVRSLVEHVFAAEKRRMGLVVRCVGLVRHRAHHAGQPRLQHASSGVDRGEMCARLIGHDVRKAAQPMPESPAQARSRNTYRRNRPQPASAPASLPVIRGVQLQIDTGHEPAQPPAAKKDAASTRPAGQASANRSAEVGSSDEAWPDGCHSADPLMQHPRETLHAGKENDTRGGCKLPDGDGGGVGDRLSGGPLDSPISVCDPCQPPLRAASEM